MDAYKELIEKFLIEYLDRRKWQIENNFLIMLDVGSVANVLKNIHSTPFYHQLEEIARAAAGELDDDPEGITRGVVYEGIQDLIEQLFAPPGLAYSYPPPPKSFWASPFGGMVGRAWAWCRQDELITQAEAGRLLGKSTQAVNNDIRSGRLTGYHNPDAVYERQGRTLVSREEVEAM
jgi:hypothetical protein